jgi:hypothetical protein
MPRAHERHRRRRDRARSKASRTRIGPDGVFENLLARDLLESHATGDTAVPPGCERSTGDPPKWYKAPSGHTYRWHDHRAHSMGGQPPPAVRAAPDSSSVSASGTCRSITARRIAVAGTLDWVPGPSGIWLPLVIVLFAIGVLADCGARLRRYPHWSGCSRRRHRMPSPMKWADWRAGAGPGNPRQLRLDHRVVRRVAVIVGLVRRNRRRSTAIVVASWWRSSVAQPISALWKSQLVNVGPGWLTRLEIVVASHSASSPSALVRAFDRSRRRDAPTSQWLAARRRSRRRGRRMRLTSTSTRCWASRSAR